jgi:hypothetical protein
MRSTNCDPHHAVVKLHTIQRLFFSRSKRASCRGIERRNLGDSRRVDVNRLVFWHINASIAPLLIVALGALALTSCSASKPTIPARSPSTESTVAAAPTSATLCALQSVGDLIEWSRNLHPPYSDGSTGLPASANEIGDIDGVNCRNYLDEFQALHAGNSADTSAGYRDCYEIAWASDNVGYNVGAVPAPRLNNVIQQAGNDC